MPRGDRRGPVGLGPMTGRAAGYCAGYSVPGYMNPIPGRFGFGRGWGRGRAFGWSGIGYPGYYPEAPYFPGISPEEEEKMLRQQAEAMESQLEEIQKRLQELESEAKK
jgi:hypothetical protein